MLDARANPLAVALPRGQSAVFLAAIRDWEARKVCELLVEHRMDPTIVDTQLEQTALFFAVRNHKLSGGVDCARYLISQRCDPDHVDKHGHTPLFYAVQRPDPECMQALIMAGADPNKCDSINQTPVFYAAKSSAEKCMKELLSARADATVRDAMGRTALFLCTSPPVAELLMENGCGANVRNNTGQTALFLAAERGLVDVTRALLNLRCEIDIMDSSGETSLFHAARKNEEDVCRVLLVEGGADVSWRNHQGLMAIDKTHVPAVKKLLALHAAAAASLPARKRGLEASNGGGCSSNGSQVSTIERDTRRKCVLIFKDRRGRTISPGDPGYKVALRELVAECPWLNGWDNTLDNMR